AQQQGQYRGQTDQNQVIQFVVNMSGKQLCADMLGFAVILDCPLTSAHPSWGNAFGGCHPITDGSFEFVIPALDGALVTYKVTGQFTSDTDVQGTITFQASHLAVVDGQVIDAQLCHAEPGWTASLVTDATALSLTGNTTVRFTDKNGNVATSYGLDTN